MRKQSVIWSPTLITISESYLGCLGVTEQIVDHSLQSSLYYNYEALLIYIAYKSLLHLIFHRSLMQ
jgi:hypothetical protein